MGHTNTALSHVIFPSFLGMHHVIFPSFLGMHAVTQLSHRYLLAYTFFTPVLYVDIPIM